MSRLGICCIELSQFLVYLPIAKCESVSYTLAYFSGYYFSGDGAHMDEEGYYRITGRMDDVINVSGHRLGTAEIEDVLVGNIA